MPLSAEFTFASSIASGTYSMPTTCPACRATKLAIVPVPVKLTWTGYKGGNFGETETHTESGVFTLSAETKALAGGLNDSRSNAESATAQTPTVTCR